MEDKFVNGKNIKGMLSHNTLRKGKTLEEVYGKEKADEWKLRKSISARGEKNPHFGKHHSEEHKQKISNSMKGKMPKNLSEINKNKKGKGNPMYGRKGKSSPVWKGGTSFEPYDLGFNQEFKDNIKLRDNSQCQLCGKIQKILCVHHINYDKQLTIKENCISLCHACHLKTNWHRKSWINFFQSLLTEVRGYKYENNKIILKNDI